MSSNGETSPAYGKGKLILHHQHPKIVIDDVLYVPEITKTLIGTRSLTDQGFTITIDDTLRIQDKTGRNIITAKHRNGLHYIPGNACVSSNMTISLAQAHRRLGHASIERLKHTSTSATGLRIGDHSPYFCESCAQGKSRQQPFPQVRQTTPREIFDIVSSDLKGPILVPSKEGHRYYITFNCLFSKWCWISFLKQKTSEAVLEATKRFITDAQSETGLRMTTFLTDNGSQYVNKDMDMFLLQKNIKHQRTTPYSSQQNGLAERRNLTIMSMARCVLIESNLPYEYWPFAVRYAVYTMNRLPTKAINWKTPYEIWMKHKPRIDYLRPFGCVAYAHINKNLRTSLEPTSTSCIFLGYAQYQKGFVLEQNHDRKIVIRRDVTFDENKTREIELRPIQEHRDPLAITDSYEFENNLSTSEYPKTYKEAMSRPDSHLWQQAALEELKSHEKHNTWTLTNLPPNAKTIKGKWVFSKKKQLDGSTRYKARFVAKGYSQIHGVDCTDTYASVLAYSSLRLLIFIAVNKSWKIYQKDFKTAYLNAPLLTPIYIEQPDGFVKQGANDKVCLLNKALYGLKQAGRAWQAALFSLIKSQNYQQSQKEPCIWFKIDKDNLVLIGVYVDDILITGGDDDEIQRMSNKMKSTFDLKDMGEMKEFQGIEIIYNRNGITLSQAKYTKLIVRTFGQEHCKMTETPMSTVYEDDQRECNEKYPIREAIGCLMYLAKATRPDIAFAVNNVSRFVTKPTRNLWTAIQRIFKYLNSTLEIGLTYTRGKFEIVGWADSNYANDRQDRKSTTGWAFKIGTNLISWKSKKQSSVSLSTTEAEYMAASDCTKEAIWLQDIMYELHLISTKH